MQTILKPELGRKTELMRAGVGRPRVVSRAYTFRALIIVFCVMLLSQHCLAGQLGVPYIQQCYDTANNFDGRTACAPTAAVMVLAYYKRIAPNRITCNAYGNTPTHTGDYGFYVSNPYWSTDGLTYFAGSSGKLGSRTGFVVGSHV